METSALFVWFGAADSTTVPARVEESFTGFLPGDDNSILGSGLMN
jgi:hypothetical protein